MKHFLIPAVLVAACGLAAAKIPAPVLDDAAKAKAAEAAAKTAWQGKVDNWQLCKAQDKVAAQYRKTAGMVPAKDLKDAKAAAPTAPAAPVAAASAAGTPVAAAPVIAPCTDPGPFAYTPPEQKPLEASGAHSPPGTASSPPSTKTPAAAMDPAKKS
ncbi:hypothetical protein [uncultured Ramlibacter sp.]|uniref:hypothetical protein n=1 Tax=uncultured Ramlibacter sp. TaxID=260755 RepID=UPI0026279A31|nr:hypothetical protein [uncultured Ramlibacter sp.]